MRIKKMYQGGLPENKILNIQSESSTDTYSCDYINNLNFSVDELDELPIDSIIEYAGTDVPDGWEIVSESDTGEVYSEEETVIGTWFGKPLYRKSITFNTLITTDTTLEVPHEVENIERMWIDNSATFFWANSGISCNLPMVGYGGNTTTKVYAYIDGTNIKIYSNGGWNTGWYKTITIRYTKTTD